MTSIERLDASAYRIPTEAPEADGTLVWSATTLVVAEVTAGGVRGLGYTYADAATALLIRETLAPALRGLDARATPCCWRAMTRAVRNLGWCGVAAMAVSAVDVALWDAKAKMLGVSLLTLLGGARTGVPIYGSGGFTSLQVEALREQLEGWVAAGIPRVKMKVGSDPTADVSRVRSAREAIGRQPQLFVDANGAYSRKQALRLADEFAAARVSWLEEPVPSDDREGLRFIRERVPAELEVAAGEYCYRPGDARLLLEAEAVDVLQADATRCGGVTGFLEIAALCAAHAIPLSAHCAPQLHAHLGCAASPARHVEYFRDHARIEGMLFDGALKPVLGELEPDPSRPGLGIELKREDARRYAL